jgi:sn-glycerol 3-phosphate transport system substrate-binding protein
MQGRYAIRPQFVGTYEEAINKLRAALMAGRSPHLAQIYEIGTGIMVDSGAVTPLADFASKDPEFPMAALLPQVIRYYSVNGRLYSLPFATSNPILFYNADLFARAGITEPPRTFEELAADAEKLTDKKQRISGLTWPLTCWIFEQFMARNGLPLLEPDNGRSGVRPVHAAYQNPVAREYFRQLAVMTASGAFANLGRAWDPAEQSFLAGRAAMLVTSTSDVFFIAKEAPFHVRTAPIVPLASQAHGAGGTVIGGNALWIMAGKPAAEQRIAYDFVKYIASAPVQREWHTHTGYFPIRRDVIDALAAEGFYKTAPDARTAIDQMLASPAEPPAAGAITGIFTELRDHVETATEEILAGFSTPDAALQKATRRTDQALARYNRLVEGQ